MGHSEGQEDSLRKKRINAPPIHRDGAPPEIPAAVIKRWPKARRDAWLREVELYNERLAEERRAAFRHRRGY